MDNKRFVTSSLLVKLRSSNKEEVISFRYILSYLIAKFAPTGY